MEVINEAFLNISRKIYKIFFARFKWGRRLKHWIYPNFQIKDYYSLLKHPAELCSELHFPSSNPIDLKFIKIPDCTLFGGTRFVVRHLNASISVAQTSVDIFAKYSDYYFQEEIHGRAQYLPDTRLLHIKNSEQKLYLSGNWVNILTPNSENWMHWLSEHIPRVAKMIATGKNLSFGILHDNMPPSALEALTIIAENRKMVTIPVGSAVKVEYLLLPREEKFEYSAFWPRMDHKLTGSFVFDSEAILLARSKLLNHFGIEPSGRRKAFVRRVSGHRLLLNQTVLEEKLAQEGFDVVEPGSLSLSSQIAFFSEISLLVCQASAALANMLFMPKGSRVICLCADSDFTNGQYFSEYAKLLDIEIIPVKGKIHNPDYYCPNAGGTEHPVNAEFYCTIEQIIQACEAPKVNVECSEAG